MPPDSKPPSIEEVAKRLSERLATPEGKAALEAASERSRAHAEEIAERTRVDPEMLTKRVTY